MNYLTPVLTAIGTVIVAGGGGALVAFFILKAVAKGWLDSFFQTKAANLKNEQEVALAELKRVHDTALKDVQAVIDKDLHRARKLYDREFDVLGDAWKLLVKSFDTANSTVWSEYPRIHLMDEKRRARMFEVEEFEHWQIDQVLALEGDDMSQKFHELTQRVRLHEYRGYRLELARYLAENGVFMPSGFKERFTDIDALISAALVEFEVRISHPPLGQDGAAHTKLTQVGRPLLEGLERSIHERIWSASAERSEASF